MTPKQRKAARLVADGLTTAEVAQRLAVTERTVRNWKRLPAFCAAVEEAMRPWLEQASKLEIADRENRVARLNADRLRLLAIRDARAHDPSVQDVPGGRTGLVYRCGKTKTTPTGATEETEEFRVDYRMLNELREIEEQAARELGQRVEKHMTVRSFRDLSDEELMALVAEGAREFGDAIPA